MGHRGTMERGPGDRDDDNSQDAFVLGRTVIRGGRLEGIGERQCSALSLVPWCHVVTLAWSFRRRVLPDVTRFGPYRCSPNNCCPLNNRCPSITVGSGLYMWSENPSPHAGPVSVSLVALC